MKPRVLFVGRERIRLPLDRRLERKWAALAEAIELRVVATAAAEVPSDDARFRLVAPQRFGRLDPVAFYGGLPFRVARELREFRPDAVVAQSAYEAAAVLLARRLAGRRAPVVLDVHGDWRTATRLYGSPLRRLVAPLGDAVALRALRRADAVRTISDYTTGLVRALGIEPAATFPAFMDLEPFAGPPAPLPERPVALFVGVLELYKNVDGLAAAWRRIAHRVPEAMLHVVGKGPRERVVTELAGELPERVRWSPALPPDAVARAMDEATCLVLPSRSEGMGRVVLEAFCRGRPVVATAVGGIPDVVRHGENGLLVPPGRTDALGEALVRILSDRELAERLAAAARPSVEPWLATPQEYAERVVALLEALGDDA